MVVGYHHSRKHPYVVCGRVYFFLGEISKKKSTTYVIFLGFCENFHMLCVEELICVDFFLGGGVQKKMHIILGGDLFETYLEDRFYTTTRITIREKKNFIPLAKWCQSGP